MGAFCAHFLFLRMVCAIRFFFSNFSFAGSARGQFEPVWPVVIGTPLGPPGSFLQHKFQFIVPTETNVGTGLLDGPAENLTSMGEFFEYIAV